MIMSSFRVIGMKPWHRLVGSSVQVSAAELQIIRRGILLIIWLTSICSQNVFYIIKPGTRSSEGRFEALYANYCKQKPKKADQKSYVNQ